MAVKKFIQANTDDSELNLEREKELVEELERIKRENLKLKEALEFYKKKSPTVKPPPFMLTPQWEAERVHFNIAKFEEDDDDTEEDGPPKMEMQDHHIMEMENGPSSKESEIEAKAKQLVEFWGGNISIPIAMAALRKADMEVENAAFYLSDETFLMEFMKEAEQMTELDKGGDENPNKKQKTKSNSQIPV